MFTRNKLCEMVNSVCVNNKLKKNLGVHYSGQIFAFQILIDMARFSL